VEVAIGVGDLEIAGEWESACVLVEEVENGCGRVVLGGAIQRQTRSRSRNQNRETFGRQYQNRR